MPTWHHDPALARLAERARTEPYFLGHAVAIYQQVHGLDDDALCRLLGCDQDTLTRLRLCRRPANETECRQIAERFGVPAGLIEEMAR